MLTLFKKNLKALDDKAKKILAAVTLKPDQAQGALGQTARLCFGPKGSPALSIISQEKEIRLTSAINPEGEDRALVEKFLKESPSPKGVLVMGFGLGYHLEQLFQLLDKDTPIWVLESRPELLACAMMTRDLHHIFKRPNFRLFLGPFPKNISAEIAVHDFKTLWRPSCLRLFFSEYPKPLVENKFLPAKGLRLLIFQSGYFLNREVFNAAQSLGLEVDSWNFEAGALASEKIFQELLQKIKTFRPQMILTINHLGFDQEGLLADILQRLHIPVASWFVDSPFFVLGENKCHQSPGLSVFSWDRDYIEPLKEIGFERVHFLPLATCPKFFQPPVLEEAPEYQYSFVGDSLHQASLKFLGRLDLSVDALKEVDLAARKFLANNLLLPGKEEMKMLLKHLGGSVNDASLMDFSALVTWRASRLWRQMILEPLAATGHLALAGDPHWGAVFKAPQVRMLAGPDYYGGLARLYQRSAINLNITSAQMKTGLNQRVFDVPAAGAFLLTDDRAQLAEVFQPGQEVICYQSPEEAKELARWYAARPQARQKIIAAARYRLSREHHYSQRLQSLIRQMRKDHGF